MQFILNTLLSREMIHAKVHTASKLYIFSKNVFEVLWLFGYWKRVAGLVLDRPEKQITVLLVEEFLYFKVDLILIFDSKTKKQSKKLKVLVRFKTLVEIFKAKKFVSCGFHLLKLICFLNNI